MIATRLPMLSVAAITFAALCSRRATAFRHADVATPLPTPCYASLAPLICLICFAMLPLRRRHDAVMLMPRHFFAVLLCRASLRRCDCFSAPLYDAA